MRHAHVKFGSVKVRFGKPKLFFCWEVKKLSRGNEGSLPVGRQEATRWEWKRASFLVGRDEALYARYLCSRDALGLKAEAKRARDDRVSCIQDEAPHWEGRNFPSGKGRSFLEEASCWKGRKLFIGKGEKLPGAHTRNYLKATLREGSKLSGGKKEVG